MGVTEVGVKSGQDMYDDRSINYLVQPSQPIINYLWLCECHVYHAVCLNRELVHQVEPGVHGASVNFLKDAAMVAKSDAVETQI
jgi:hypothetical protein